jgi:hypothetical protein
MGTRAENKFWNTFEGNNTGILVGALVGVLVGVQYLKKQILCYWVIIILTYH